MILTYEYQVKPRPEQEAIILYWLELLRPIYHYQSGELKFPPLWDGS